MMDTGRIRSMTRGDIEKCVVKFSIIDALVNVRLWMFKRKCYKSRFQCMVGVVCKEGMIGIGSKRGQFKKREEN